MSLTHCLQHALTGGADATVSSSMDYGRHELADRLAADDVIGTMRGRARRRLEVLLPVRDHEPSADYAPWWSRLAFWRLPIALASVAAVSLAVHPASPPPAQAPVVVVLSGTAGAAEGVQSLVASVTADGRALVPKPLVTVSVEAGRALEPWSVPAQRAPRSLSLISSRAATVLQPGKLLDRTSALAVSLTPAGGSRTGAPTGPILYVGKLTS